MIELTTPISRTRKLKQTSYVDVEDTFDGLWVSNIRISSTPNGSTSAVIDLIPFDSETGQMSKNGGDARQLIVPDVYVTAAEFPQEVGAGIAGLLASIDFLVAQYGLADEGVKRVDVSQPDGPDEAPAPVEDPPADPA